MKILNDSFEIIMGSDVHRDGMYLELIELESGDEVAEVFYSDQSHQMTVSIYKSELPLESVEVLISEAKRRLPEQRN